ncbi:MAG: hypothetical protein Q9226_005864 [Calogaya cf. arnoldii]
MSKRAAVEGIRSLTKSLASRSIKPLYTIQNARCASTKTETESDSTTKAKSELATSEEEPKTPKKKKTMAELDEELRMKLEGRSGEGGEAGLELEDGRPAAMKRGVKNNMFRLI